MKWIHRSVGSLVLASYYASMAVAETDMTAHQELRIYGGDEADAAQFPFIASLRKSMNGTTYCGAALIAPEYLVTAAHCVKPDTDMYAALGSKYSSGDEGGERIKIAERFVHPKYVKKDHLYDVAVLKLESAATVEPVSLCSADGSDHSAGTNAFVRGWGMTESGKASDTMLEVGVKIISNEECNKQYNDRIKDHMICAGEGDGKDTCQGDSGGPLMVEKKLVGVVSWGGKCGEQAGVYTRITHITDFIQQHTGLKPEQTKAPSVAPTSAPTETPMPSKTPAPTTATPVPSETPEATTVIPSKAPKPYDTPAPTKAPVPSKTPVPSTPTPSAKPTSTPVPDAQPSSTPKPVTQAPTPMPTSAPTKGPEKTPAPTPMPTSAPTKGPKKTPAPTSSAEPSPSPSPSSKKDRCDSPKDEDEKKDNGSPQDPRQHH